MHQTSKTIGMSIIERLVFLDDDFHLVSGTIQSGTVRSIAPHLRNSLNRLKNRFVNFIYIVDGKTLLSLDSSAFSLPDISYEQRQHLDAGKTVLLSVQTGDHKPRIFMVRSLPDPAPVEKLLIGEVHGEYLWGLESIISATMSYFVTDESRKCLYLSSADDAPDDGTMQSLKGSSSIRNFRWSRGDAVYQASDWTLFMAPRFMTNWVITLSQKEQEILAPVRSFRRTFVLIVLLTFFVVSFLSLNQIRKSLVPIEELKTATEKIASKDYSSRVVIESNDEFSDLGASFNTMMDGIERNLETMETIYKIGISLTAEKDSNVLLKNILLGAKSITKADGYALYSVSAENTLTLSIMLIDSLDLVIGASGHDPVPIRHEKGNPNMNNVVAYAVASGSTVNVPHLYSNADFDFTANKEFDRKIGYRSHSILAVPLRDHENEVIGALQLINARQNTSEELLPFTSEDQRLAEALASEAAVAISKNRLVEDMHRLFDALVELISKAIDEKSPYTGGHSRRVSELTLMLAETLSNMKEGPYRDIEFSGDELYELRIASLLHDCGKVTTPVHIMDKGTKLETIFDRIDLIDTRFEIIKRDIQLTMMQPRSTGDVPDMTEEEPAHRLRRIEEDRTFIRKCNNGDVPLTDDDKNRLRDIAARYEFVRDGDNATPLLSDEELYNLSIIKGTINPQERDILNHHIELTIRMLESLPYPRSLRNVPVYVATHHERYDGSGYPKGLKGEEIPLPGRILAMADIFEALVAKDRPYKRGKTINEALTILGQMKEDRQIDPELFDLFIREKVYMRYAEKHVPPEQIDEVDETNLPGYNPSSHS